MVSHLAADFIWRSVSGINRTDPCCPISILGLAPPALGPVRVHWLVSKRLSTSLKQPVLTNRCLRYSRKLCIAMKLEQEPLTVSEVGYLKSWTFSEYHASSSSSSLYNSLFFSVFSSAFQYQLIQWAGLLFSYRHSLKPQ
jgi:hypothetical protein